MISSIAINTFRQLVRGKVLYLVFFFAALVIIVASLFGSVTIGDQIMVVKDFGLFAISLFSVIFAVIAGAALLQKELAQKTIYNILSKPVPRWKFVVGKFSGMVLTSWLLVLMMACALQIYLFAFEGAVDTAMFWAYINIACEAALICAAAIFFSSLVVTPVLSGLFTFGLFLAGRSVEYLLYFIAEGQVSEFGASILKGLYFVLPHLNQLSISAEVASSSLGFEPLWFSVWSVLYTAGYSGVLLILAALIFERRDFN